MSPLLSVRGLTKRYGSRIGCEVVDLDLWSGEVLGIVGESGSGKSTLLTCLAGHLDPDAGRVAYEPRDVLTLRRDRLSYVSQFLRVVPRVPALEVVADPLRALGVPQAEAEARNAVADREVDVSVFTPEAL